MPCAMSRPTVPFQLSDTEFATRRAETDATRPDCSHRIGDYTTGPYYVRDLPGKSDTNMSEAK